MIYKPKIGDPLLSLIKDDPVRPEIPVEFRVGNHEEVLVLLNEDSTPAAVVCVAYRNNIPTNCDELLKDTEETDTVIFYTIWSYKNGAGRKLLNEASKIIKEEHPDVKRFVTLSPKTEMARRFHLTNGANIFRENTDTINYEYLIGQL